VLFQQIRRHGSRRGNMVQALAQWRHPVASSEALDVLHWAMCPALYRRVCMAIKIASNSPTFSLVIDSLLPTTIAKKHSNS
jgi:hypothetical protein